jgi:hypothetical protein
MERVLVVARVSKYFAIACIANNRVFNERLTIISDNCFTILQSSFHEKWMLSYGSTLETRPMYTPSDCFETFPFPTSYRQLNEIGEKYYNYRQSIMLTRQEGLTDTYNRFHNPNETSADIAKLRQLHKEMDEAVAAAYGWTDLDLGHGFHQTKQGMRYTISEEARREVLDRLLELNHARYAEEVAAGLHDTGKSKKKGAAKKPKAEDVNNEQGSLF